MPRVTFENIVKTFGAVKVIEGLDLAIDHGEFLVLLGPSGCGKTTLLNLLAGLLDLTSGRLVIGDRDVSNLDPKDRGLAMVFQSYALYPTKSVEGNLRFGLSARHLDRAEADRRIAWAAELLQITHLLKRRPAELSGGQRQRVAIGRALVKQADVILFDEPLSNLDAKLRTEMRQEIKKLHDTLRPTVVYVTHDQVEAMTLATRIAIMDKGRVQQFGTPDEIYHRPANLFVAGFIGSPPMNLITPEGPLTGAEGTLLGLRPEQFRFDPHPGDIALPMTVTMIERAGSEAHLVASLGRQSLTVKTDPDRAATLMPGQSLTLHFPPERLHRFDSATGARL